MPKNKWDQHIAGNISTMFSVVNFGIAVLNSSWLLVYMFYVPHHLFQPNFLPWNWMIDLVYCLTNLLFFDIPLLYYYNIDISSSMFVVIFNDILSIFYPPPDEKTVWYYEKANTELVRRAIDRFDWWKTLSKSAKFTFSPRLSST